MYIKIHTPISKDGDVFCTFSKEPVIGTLKIQFNFVGEA